MTRIAVCAALAWLLAPQPAPRPPVLGLAHVRVRTTDLGAARRFYGGLLGLPELAQSAPSVAVYSVNDRQRIVVLSGPAPDGDDRFVDVAWETSDLPAMKGQLAAKGIEARAVVNVGQGDGDGVETTDPDGHLIRLIGGSGKPSRLDGPERRISRRILHTGLTVRDAAAADRFYKDVLGFSEIWRGGRPEGVTSWINMRVPDGTDYLEYMLTPGPLDRRQLGTAHHIALLVPDIQTALETVRERTADGDPNHRATPQIGVNRRWQLNVYDPDGTRIEFMEPWTAR